MPRTLTELPNESRISIVDVSELPAVRCPLCLQQPAGERLMVDASLIISASDRVKVFAAELYLCARCIRAAHDSIEEGKIGHFIQAEICLLCLDNPAEWTSSYFFGVGPGRGDGLMVELDGQRLELNKAGICRSCAEEAFRKLTVEENARKRKELIDA